MIDHDAIEELRNFIENSDHAYVDDVAACEKAHTALDSLLAEIEGLKEAKVVMHYWAKDYKQERDDAQAELTRLETQLAEATANGLQLIAENERLQKELNTRTTQLDEMAALDDERIKENEGLREDITRLERAVKNPRD